MPSYPPRFSSTVSDTKELQRTRHQINYPETYELVFNRLHQELRAAEATGKPIKHLVVLLGIPIAYPV